jgi:MOSC domain-containing protein YiiM
LTACRKSNADPCTKVTRYLGNRERYKVMQRDLCTGAGLRVTERELLTWFEGLHE